MTTYNIIYIQELDEIYRDTSNIINVATKYLLLSQTVWDIYKDQSNIINAAKWDIYIDTIIS